MCVPAENSANSFFKAQVEGKSKYVLHLWTGVWSESKQYYPAMSGSSFLLRDTIKIFFKSHNNKIVLLSFLFSTLSHLRDSMLCIWTAAKRSSSWFCRKKATKILFFFTSAPQLLYKVRKNLTQTLRGTLMRTGGWNVKIERTKGSVRFAGCS